MLRIDRHFAVAGCLLLLGACGGGGGHVGLTTSEVPPTATHGERLNNQPTLAMVNANHAYARGHSGAGVRIGINDDSVEFQHDEFAGRIGFEGAELTYWDPEGASHCRRAGSGCRVFDVDSFDEVSDQARRIIERDGYPRYDNTWYVRISGEDDIAEYHEIPAVGESTRTHGTAVASIAAGRTLGIAPGATIVPMATPLDADSENQQAVSDIETILIDQIGGWGPDHPEVRALDEDLAESLLDMHKSVEVINRSYGVSSSGDWALYQQHLLGTAAAISWLRRHLPRSYGMLTQEDVPEPHRTLIVHAAGNDGLFAPSSSAGLPLHVPELRGLHLAAVALDAQGALASYSNRCGPLSSDWNPARDGRHYCLSAPGNVNFAVAGTERKGSGGGTSYAAPMVAGGAALVMEAFRGQLTVREVGLRLVNTADNRGIYAEDSIYGAGLMDLEAATRPIGPLSTGTSAVSAPLASTRLRTPAAWGNVAARVEGAEAAAYDSDNAPFWHDPAAFFESSGASAAYPVIPAPERPGGARNAGPFAHLEWTDMSTSDRTRKHQLQIAAYPGPTGLRGEPVAGETFGLSLRPFGERWRTGFIVERGSHQGTRPSGAFGTKANANMAWVEARRQWALDGDGGRWSLQAEGLLALGRPEYEAGAMFQATHGVYSAAALSLGHRDDATGTRLGVAQPLRAESGKGTLTYSTGRATDGTRRYTRISFPLVPETRAVRVSLRHDRETPAGKVALELAHTFNAGHTRGAEHTAVGAAYGIEW